MGTYTPNPAVSNHLHQAGITRIQKITLTCRNSSLFNGISTLQASGKEIKPTIFPKVAVKSINVIALYTDVVTRVLTLYGRLAEVFTCSLVH